MATGFSVKSRFLLLQAEYRETVIGIAFFCALPLAALIPIAMNQNNTVVGTQRVEGIVENATPMPVAPKAVSGRGLYYQYGIRLSDNTLVSVDGELDTPHVIGSEVSLEREHHKNSADTFRLLLD